MWRHYRLLYYFLIKLRLERWKISTNDKKSFSSLSIDYIINVPFNSSAFLHLRWELLCLLSALSLIWLQIQFSTHAHLLLFFREKTKFYPRFRFIGRCHATFLWNQLISPSVKFAESFWLFIMLGVRVHLRRENESKSSWTLEIDKEKKRKPFKKLERRKTQSIRQERVR